MDRTNVDPCNIVLLLGQLHVDFLVLIGALVTSSVFLFPSRLIDCCVVFSFPCCSGLVLSPRAEPEGHCHSRRGSSPANLLGNGYVPNSDALAAFARYLFSNASINISEPWLSVPAHSHRGGAIVSRDGAAKTLTSRRIQDKNRDVEHTRARRAHNQ